MNQIRIHKERTNHCAFLQLKENSVLKDLSCLSRDGICSMLFAFSYKFAPQISSLTSFFTNSLGNDGYHNNFSDSRRFKLILWSIIGGTRGGPNRARILNLLMIEPLNSHQISKKLSLDHKTIRHHLKILTKNSLITKSSEESYGANYILTPLMKQNVESLKEIVTKMRKKG
jgi:DNA-binding transcriptional ArsR family regulator